MSHSKPNLTNVSNLISTDTNLMVECFANPDKIISDPDYSYDKNYDNENYHNSLNNNLNDADNNMHSKLDENIDDYKSYKKNTYSDKEYSDNNSYKNKNTNFSENNTDQNTKTIDPDDESMWTADELRFRKLRMLTKLGELTQCGVKLSYDYNMDSSYKDMKLEYDLQSGIRSKGNAVKMMGGVLYIIVKGIEMFNDNYNPFGF